MFYVDPNFMSFKIARAKNMSQISLDAQTLKEGISPKLKKKKKSLSGLHGLRCVASDLSAGFLLLPCGDFLVTGEREHPGAKPWGPLGRGGPSSGPSQGDYALY